MKLDTREGERAKYEELNDNGASFSGSSLSHVALESNKKPGRGIILPEAG